MKARDKRNIIILAIVALILISGFLFIGVNSVNFRYALYIRTCINVVKLSNSY